MIVRLLAIRAASERAASNKRPELSVVAGDWREVKSRFEVKRTGLVPLFHRGGEL